MPPSEKDPYELHELIEQVQDHLIECDPMEAVLLICQAFDLDADDVASQVR
jgi:hypothetical protein